MDVEVVVAYFRKYKDIYLQIPKPIIRNLPRGLDMKPGPPEHKPQRSYRGADKSLAPPGRKQATATEDFEFHISYL
jgi:hypothetical protein